MQCKMEEALDHAFANSHSQIFAAISNLQRRLLLIQSGIGKPQTPAGSIDNVTEIIFEEEEVDVEASDSPFVDEPPKFFGPAAPP